MSDAVLQLRHHMHAIYDKENKSITDSHNSNVSWLRLQVTELCERLEIQSILDNSHKNKSNAIIDPTESDIKKKICAQVQDYQEEQNDKASNVASQNKDHSNAVIKSVDRIKSEANENVDMSKSAENGSVHIENTINIASGTTDQEKKCGSLVASEWTVVRLRKDLKKRGLKCGGLKTELLRRLEEAIAKDGTDMKETLRQSHEDCVSHDSYVQNMNAIDEGDEFSMKKREGEVSDHNSAVHSENSRENQPIVQEITEVVLAKCEKTLENPEAVDVEMQDPTVLLPNIASPVHDGHVAVECSAMNRKPPSISVKSPDVCKEKAFSEEIVRDSEETMREDVSSPAQHPSNNDIASCRTSSDSVAGFSPDHVDAHKQFKMTTDTTIPKEMVTNVDCVPDPIETEPSTVLCPSSVSTTEELVATESPNIDCIASKSPRLDASLPISPFVHSCTSITNINPSPILERSSDEHYIQTSSPQAMAEAQDGSKYSHCDSTSEPKTDLWHTTVSNIAIVTNNEPKRVTTKAQDTSENHRKLDIEREVWRIRMAAKQSAQRRYEEAKASKSCGQYSSELLEARPSLVYSKPPMIHSSIAECIPDSTEIPHKANEISVVMNASSANSEANKKCEIMTEINVDSLTQTDCLTQSAKSALTPCNLVSNLHSFTSLLTTADDKKKEKLKNRRKVPMIAALKKAERLRQLEQQRKLEKARRLEALRKKHVDARAIDAEVERKSRPREVVEARIQETTELSKRRREKLDKAQKSRADQSKMRPTIAHTKQPEQSVPTLASKISSDVSKSKQSKPVERDPGPKIMDGFESDGSTHASEKCRSIPAWARKENLEKIMHAQYEAQLVDPSVVIFPDFVDTCDLEKVFDTVDSCKKKRFAKRNSSGNWMADRPNARDKALYRKDMGF